jgi:hypothetical protein
LAGRTGRLLKPADAGTYGELSRRRGSGDDPLVLVFLPTLMALLARAERQKGEPLTDEEILQVRDGAACSAVPRSVSDSIAQRRGYADIDPVDVCASWDRMRAVPRS